MVLDQKTVYEFRRNLQDFYSNHMHAVTIAIISTIESCDFRNEIVEYNIDHTSIAITLSATSDMTDKFMKVRSIIRNTIINIINSCSGSDNNLPIKDPVFLYCLESDICFDQYIIDKTIHIQL